MTISVLKDAGAVPQEVSSAPFELHMSHHLNSLKKGGYIGDYIRDYYRAY